VNGHALLQLQHLDSQLEQLGHRRLRLPELLARDAAAGALRDHRAALAAAEARMAAAQSIIEQCEHDGEDITKKRTRLEQQLKTVIAPREAEALMHEIATLNAKRGDVDEAELVAMDAVAEAEDAALALGENTAGLEATLAQAEAALAEAVVALDAEQAEADTQRSAAAAALTATELATYDRMKAQFKGVAVAKLEGMQCMGCHLDLSRAEVDEIRRLPPEDVPECPQCGRLLVR
jgi:predicted  nucleic acid-binding Zn-ribbon protein